MKLITIVFVAVLCLMGAWALGARSSRPDLTLSAAEELSVMRAEVAYMNAPLAPPTETDKVKIKALADAKEAKRLKDVQVGTAIRKSHNCEVCAFRWDTATDGAIRFVIPESAPIPVPEKKETK